MIDWMRNYVISLKKYAFKVTLWSLRFWMERSDETVWLIKINGEI